MEKGPDAFRTISEVADDLDLPQHVLRFWETRFPQIRPLKRGGGRRYYRPDDIELLRGIRHLLYSEGYTIRGVQRILKEEGPRYVQAIWRDAEAEALEVAEFEDIERRQGAREPVDAGHPGRDRDAGAREAEPAPRGGALSGLLNLLPSRQRESARDAGRDGPPPEPAPREPDLREPSFREPSLREPTLRDNEFRDAAPREPGPREPVLRDPALFDEPPAGRRGGRRRPENEPDFLELPLLPDLAPQTRPPRGGEPLRPEPDVTARYVGPLDSAPADFAPRRSEPLMRPAEPRASFPFRPVAPEPDPDEVMPFAAPPEPRPPHILARQPTRPMPVAVPATPMAASAASPAPRPVEDTPPPRMAERAVERPAEPAPSLTRDDVQRLQAALYELQECRRILDAARN